MTKLYAVYGSLRKGLSNHRVLGDSKLLGEVETSPSFTMVSLHSFPGVMPGGKTSITLEIYEVNDLATESRLDSLEGYRGKGDISNFYNKEVISTPFGDAYIYFLNEPVERFSEERKVINGDWKNYLFNKNLKTCVD